MCKIIVCFFLIFDLIKNFYSNMITMMLTILCLLGPSIASTSGHITTEPACSCGTFRHVLPHRHTMTQTQDMAPIVNSHTILTQGQHVLSYVTGVKTSKIVHLFSGQVHLHIYLSCCQIKLGIQGNITLLCNFLFARRTLNENICFS